ncbi:MAG: amidase [Rhodospirillales bacterium]|jgi:amidase|nr:amidase [Rhodospirillales bacterium]
MTQSQPDPFGAFVPGPRTTVGPLGTGRLSGLRFAVKDLFDVAGTVTGYGHPDWARTHPPAIATAPIVTALLQAGASLAGKTRTMELAFGLTGENIWQGTPINPVAPDRFPGGSSCGSAVAVAGELVDFALGSDTGGSVRIPASYCGLFGLRPTHGAVSLAGARGLAPSLDTPGWFARSASVLAAVGDVLLPNPAALLSGPLLLVEEAWMNAQLAVAKALRPKLERLEALCGRAMDVRLAPEGIDSLYDHIRAVQAEEAWATLGDWVATVNPTFGPGIGARFAAARAMDPSDALRGRTFRRMFQARVHPLLAGGAILVYPTSPCAAPLLASPLSEQESVRQATVGVTAIAGFCGLPEVTLPAARLDGAPLGLSLVAGPGRDQALLAFACDAATVLGLPV